MSALIFQFPAQLKEFFCSYRVLQISLFSGLNLLCRTLVVKQKFRRSLRLSLVAVLTALVVAACGNNPKVSNRDTAPAKMNSSCQVVQHKLGETQICEQPQRIIALDPHVLDLMLSLGVQPAGYAEVNYLASKNSGDIIKQIPYLGSYVTSNPISVGTREQPSLEAILRLEPDLILRDWPNSSLYAKLSKIAPTLFFRNEPDKYQWQQGLLTLGQVLEREQRARQVIEEHNQRIATARSELRSLTRDSEVLLLSMSGSERIEVFADETFAGALLQDLGFKLVTPEGLQASSSEIPISLETLPQLNSDRIIVMASGQSNVEKIEKVWQQNPILRSQPAFQAGQVYFVDYQLWSRIRGPIATKLIIKQIRSLFLEPN